MQRSLGSVFHPASSLLLALFLVSCSEGLEADIGKWLREDLEITAESVDCPTIFGRIFRDFSCRGIAEGGTIRIQVIRGGGPSGKYRVDSGLVKVEEVEAGIERKMYDLTGELSTVACGKRFRVSVPGNGFSCVIHDPRGKTHLADVAIEDSEGTVRTRID